MNGFAEAIDRLVRPDRPDDPALIGPDGRVAYTFGSLAVTVRACAGAFARAGMEPGTAVAFGIRQDARGIAWLLGAFRAGITVVVMDPGMSARTYADQCRVAGVRATVTDGLVATIAHYSLLRTVAARRGVRLPDPATIAPAHWTTSHSLSRAGRLDRLAGGDARRPLEPTDRALVIFTSGTTGGPRGVVHGVGGLAATLADAGCLVSVGPGDRVLGSGFHLVGPALLAGATVVLPRGVDPVALARTTRRLAVTHVSLPPHHAVAWAAAGGAAPDLRVLLLGSAPIRNAALTVLADQLPGTRIIGVYGMTEHLLVTAVEAADRLPHDERTGDLVGRPIGGVRIRVGDDDEVQVAGPGLALGYLGEPMPVAELPTGDLGRLTDGGELVLIGRRKEMLIRDGRNIYPALYEAALTDAAGLDAAVLVGIPGPDANETVVLFAVPHAGEDADVARARLAAVIDGAASPLDDHARPDAILALRELPRSGRSGKPDRRALADLAARRLGLPSLEDPVLPHPA